MLIIAGIVLVLVGAVGAVIVNQRETRSEHARDALYRARASLDKELTAIAVASAPAKPAAAKTDDAENSKDAKGKAKDAEKTPPPDATAVAHKKLDVDAQLAEPVKNFKSVVDEFGATRAGFEARLALGDLYYDHGSPEKAVPWYQGAVDAAPAKLERAFALTALGYAFENSGKCGEAIPAFEKGLTLGEMGVKGDLLLAIARCHEALKDAAKARGTYDQILSQLPNTEYAKTAEILKAQLE